MYIVIVNLNTILWTWEPFALIILLTVTIIRFQQWYPLNYQNFYELLLFACSFFYISDFTFFAKFLMGFPMVYVAFKIKTLIFEPMRKLVLEIWLWALILKNRSAPWKNDFLEKINWIKKGIQPDFTCSKLTEETLEQGEKYVLKSTIKTPERRVSLLLTLNIFQNLFYCFIVNFEHVIASWLVKGLSHFSLDMWPII